MFFIVGKFVKTFLTNIRVHLIEPGKLDFEAWWIKKSGKELSFELHLILVKLGNVVFRICFEYFSMQGRL